MVLARTRVTHTAGGLSIESIRGWVTHSVHPVGHPSPRASRLGMRPFMRRAALQDSLLRQPGVLFPSGRQGIDFRPSSRPRLG